MTEKPDNLPQKNVADWFFRGALTRIGDSLDKLTGRKWTPTSSLAASELIDRIKKLLDKEAIEVPGKGTVVPHHITLKMQWDKFSDDAQDALSILQNELLAAAVDHINDSLYYTYAPVDLEVKPDYFIEGVKLFVGFGKYADEDQDAQLNVTIPSINLGANSVSLEQQDVKGGEVFVAKFTLKGIQKEQRLEFTKGSNSVGRSGSNDLVLDDESVSKMHASISLSEKGELMVADTGSTNGTFKNDERIAYGKAITVAEGDKLKFGQVAVIFHKVPRPEPDVASEPQVPADGSVEINGLSFKTKETPALPVAEEPAKKVAQTEEVPADSSSDSDRDEVADEVKSPK